MRDKWVVFGIVSLCIVGVLIIALRKSSKSDTVPSGALVPERTLELAGSLPEAEELSGAALWGGKLVVCSNESSWLAILQPTAEGYRVQTTFSISAEADRDLEALAVEGDTIYALGSHSKVRSIGKKSAPSLGGIEDHPARDFLARVRLNRDTGQPEKIETRSLRTVLTAHPLLAPFAALPSKENGIDLEGLAVSGGRLFVGFRGPVLRKNWVPVLVTPFEVPAGQDVRFVNLGGRGIRDLCATSEGFLILAGPTGDAELSFQIYFWDGRDGVVTAEPVCRLLATLPAVGNARPEAITLLSESDSAWNVLILHDGAVRGAARQFSLAK